MAGEDGVGQVVEALATASALIALAMRLGVIPTVLDDRIRGALRAGHAVGPAHVPDRLVALGVVEEVLDVHHRSTPRMPDAGGGRADDGPDEPGDCNDSGALACHHPGIHLEPRAIGRVTGTPGRIHLRTRASIEEQSTMNEFDVNGEVNVQTLRVNIDEDRVLKLTADKESTGPELQALRI